MYLYNYHNIFAMHNKQVLHFSLSQRQSVYVGYSYHLHMCVAFFTHRIYAKLGSLRLATFPKIDQERTRQMSSFQFGAL